MHNFKIFIYFSDFTTVYNMKLNISNQIDA